MTQSARNFHTQVLDYYRANRRDLPWRKSITPYRILVSEVMLQQTQVDRVIQFYKKFIRRFPSFRALARAPQSDVLELWQGLGYNRRALYLKQTAMIVTRDHTGHLPHDPDVLVTFPGIGKNTAGAICAYAFNMPVPFIETNIRSVFIHHFFNNRNAIPDKEILELVKKSLPTTSLSGRQSEQVREWYSALMDYGSHLKKIYSNPSRKSSHHIKQKPFKGSKREVRGLILKELVEKRRSPIPSLLKVVARPKHEILEVIADLEDEGFLVRRDEEITL